MSPRCPQDKAGRVPGPGQLPPAPFPAALPVLWWPQALPRPRGRCQLSPFGRAQFPPPAWHQRHPGCLPEPSAPPASSRAPRNPLLPKGWQQPLPWCGGMRHEALGKAAQPFSARGPQLPSGCQGEQQQPLAAAANSRRCLPSLLCSGLNTPSSPSCSSAHLCSRACPSSRAHLWTQPSLAVCSQT